MKTLYSSIPSVTLFLASIALSLLIFELGFKFFLQHKSVSVDSTKAYLLFREKHGGSTFRNIDKFFVYSSNAEIETAMYFDTGTQWVKEYEYAFRTNNLGLVQLMDIDSSRESVLLVGDSFTEGQGAPPWFEQLNERLPHRDFQLINGGLLGTGFQGWMRLHDRLVRQGMRIRALAVVFISDDSQREIWNMPDSTLNCLAHWNLCEGHDNFYGMPPVGSRVEFLEHLKASRSTSHLKELIKSTFPALRHAYHSVRSLSESVFLLKEEVDSYDVIKNFTSLYGEKVLFIHLPQKEELFYETISRPGRRVREKIEAVGGRLYDGFAECNLTISDYHLYDGHPNETGYRKISHCIAEALDRLSIE